MVIQEDFTVAPHIAYEPSALKEFILKTLNISEVDFSVKLLRHAIDARSRDVRVHIRVAVYINETPPISQISYQRQYPDVQYAKPVVVVGAGPAGMFAALRLIELGLKPILLERGKDVKQRTSDIANISRRHLVNPNSNFCFGEGGAGTFSDGKLYTRSQKRGDWRRILEIFVAHGASENILTDNHPHIGTNKLPRILAEMRSSILNAGGEVHFNALVTDFVIKSNEIKAVKLANGAEVEGVAVLLATGHSARDVFELLHQKNIYIEAKPFALGVRAEHAQQFIDQARYHCAIRSPYLPAASYSLVTQVPFQKVERGVFSFCMCPGGFIVPAATAQGEIVVNGMSPSKRNSKYANSGIVVAIEPEDWQEMAQHGPLAAMYYQQKLERAACVAAGGTQAAPTQLISDFVQKKVSKSLLDSSYQPGLVSVDLHAVLPPSIALRLREGFKAFDKKMKGFASDHGQILGVESRTSSPVKIPRLPDTREHVQIKRLFPCGEGAGYAGGIASAAMDGERVAEMIAALYA
ncbi:MAG: FAD-binding protein [Cytophagales bacterium]|nr:MAG: FAD-binding protein [Cytophagales bacterium]TAF60659.1 MAG: FAD-binding protein [Cytophagales bacterium]